MEINATSSSSNPTAVSVSSISRISVVSDHVNESRPCEPVAGAGGMHTCWPNHMRNSLKECLAEHDSICGKEVAHFTDVFPTRLIYVGRDKNDHARMVKFKDREHFLAEGDFDEQIGYAALSYCWGAKPDRRCLLKAENESEFQRKLPRQPKTIREAFDVCRMIGVRYCWVDALCIIQASNGNSADWVHESTRVGAYYHNAIFVIAAAWSKHNNGGCLPYLNKSPSFLWIVKYLATSSGYGREMLRAIAHEEAWGTNLMKRVIRGVKQSQEEYLAEFLFQTCPLLARAWVAQELWSARRLLWLNELDVFWLCRTQKVPQSVHTNLDRTGSMLLQLLHRDEDSRYWWYDVLSAYANMELSYVSDRLPAVSGLCKFADPRAQDHYMAGIWKTSVDCGLSWSVTPMDRLKNWSTPEGPLPTWSPLVAADGPTRLFDLTFSYVIEHERACKATDCQLGALILVKADIDLIHDDPHGQFSSATMTLDAAILPATFEIATEEDEGSLIFTPTSAEPLRVRGTLSIDPWINRKHTSCSAMLVWHSQCVESTAESIVYATLLLLNQVGKDQSVYKRIGYFEIWRKWNGSGKLQDQVAQRLERKVIKLI